MSDHSGVSLKLAEEVVAFQADGLSRADFDQLDRLLLDYAAVTLCGSVQPWGRTLTNWAAEHGAGGKVLLVGSGARAGANAAAMVNGTSAHGYELDDTHDKSMSHPGAVVITAALAAGTEAGATGRELLGAIVSGYEVMARVGMAANSLGVINRGFHPTATFGVFGAAAAAGKLYGLDAMGVAQAWGIALSMSSGACQFAFEPKGTMVKRMHAGIPAHNGVIAAQLARLGLAAPVEAFEGGYGFFKLFGVDADPGLLLKAKDAPLEIHDISLKPYSCCRKFHSLIDALEQATDGFSIDLGEIDAITVRAPKTAIGSHMMRRPDSVMAAQYSMPYIVGATLAYGPRRYDAYGTAHHTDPRILSIVDRIKAKSDAELDRLAPAKMATGVAISLRSGESREATVLDSFGTPVRPMSTQEVQAKGRALVGPLDVDYERIIESVGALAGAGDITAFADGLVVPGFDQKGEGTKAA
jgi:2-methylcitrate dehydratase PrpD